ncbi:hypothetical protein Tco_0858132 [Tanacetum coccineum]|uniref:Reverse transcriptase domain-containing protein n=1 Tax=Tanacetum coccineum TaxID=301880 RepID=A0ABQ5B8B8_9ASTR
MTCTIVKRLTKPLDQPEREFLRLKRAIWRLQQNESLAIAERNLFDAEASSSKNTGAKPPTPPKTLHKHSHPNPSSFQNPITLPTEQTGRIVDSNDIWGRIKRACNQISYLETPTQEFGLKNLYLICDYYGGSHQVDECKQTNLAEQVCLSGGDIYDDPSLLRNKFEDKLANFMLEKKSHAKGIGNMLDQHGKELHEQFSQILSMIRKRKTHESEAPTFAITTRSGVSTQDPPFPTSPRPKSDNPTEEEIEKERPEAEEPSIKKDDEDERLLLIFKQIHINLPFLEAMIHIPKGAKVLKDLLSHKEKLEKVASSVKLSEECFAIIQRSLSQKEEDPRSFTLPCLIRPLAENNKLPVVISSALSTIEKARLLEVLKNHKGAIACSIADIKGIDSSFCTHKILMEDEFKPSVQPQRRVNPNIKEVVKKEVIKLLDARLIYPISDSPWVSPVQVVPKKGG